VAGILGLSQLLDVAIRSSNMHSGSRLELIERVVAETGDENALWLLAGLVVAPAIAEELLFRGLLLRTFARHWGLAAGMLLSAAFFGAAHMDLAQGLAAGILGLYLALVAVVTGSIRSAIGCHLINNFAALAGSSGITQGVPGGSAATLVTAAAALSVGLVVLFRALPPAWAVRAAWEARGPATNSEHPEH
jgi:membrane protease YdiL (CAAX protease family)